MAVVAQTLNRQTDPSPTIAPSARWFSGYKPPQTGIFAAHFGLDPWPDNDKLAAHF